MSNADKLARIQSWLGGIKKIGVYEGVESWNLSMDQFSGLAASYAARGIDYCILKVGENGIEWYNGEFASIRDIFLNHGVGCVPYYFCRPEHVGPDAVICVKCAHIAGGIFLDCEEQFTNTGGQLRTLINTIRSDAPEIVVIVTGYGDPEYAFANTWDYSALAEADGYQPQAYIGVWDIYKQHGWQAALEWSDAQCAEAFTAGGIGTDFPIQFAINTEGVNEADFGPMAAYIAAWKDGVVVWEQQSVTDTMVAAMRSAMGSDTTTDMQSPPIAVPPAPIETPAVTIPVPTEPGQTYTVQSGDTLSNIAALHGIEDWRQIWTLNRDLIGDNPDLIQVGWVLTLPQVAADSVYIVQSGDTLSEIAASHGIADWHTLYEKNRGVIGDNPDLIQVGQKLIL